MLKKVGKIIFYFKKYTFEAYMFHIHVDDNLDYIYFMSCISCIINDCIMYLMKTLGSSAKSIHMLFACSPKELLFATSYIAL